MTKIATERNSEMVVSNAYDQIPFSSFPSPDRHPQRMSVLGHLFGLTATIGPGSRVLDLGCSSALNLIAIASSYPELDCSGVDSAANQIATGQALSESLQLKNLTLLAADIFTATPKLGKFDFIICHGLFSWIPEKNQRSLLESIKTLLAPNGLVYLSHNSLPGWETRNTLRRLLLEQTSALTTASEKIALARQLMKWLGETLSDDQNPSALGLKIELENISKQSDSFVLHELLNPDSSALFFADFLKLVCAHDLSFICEARFSRTLRHRIDQPNLNLNHLFSLAPTLNHPNRIEQFLSYLYPTALRRTILCHRERSHKDKPDYLSLKSFYISSALVPVSESEIYSEMTNEYATPQGYLIEINDPLVKQLLKIVGSCWPGAIAFSELVESLLQADARRGSRQDLEAKLEQQLFILYCQDLIDLYSYPLPFTTAALDKPLLFPLAQQQLKEQNWATNLRHEYVVLNEFERSVALLCDGARDKSDISSALQNEMASGKLKVTISGKEIIDQQEQLEIIQSALEETIDGLGKKALFFKTS